MKNKSLLLAIVFCFGLMGNAPKAHAADVSFTTKDYLAISGLAFGGAFALESLSVFYIKYKRQSFSNKYGDSRANPYPIVRENPKEITMQLLASLTLMDVSAKYIISKLVSLK